MGMKTLMLSVDAFNLAVTVYRVTADKQTALTVLQQAMENSGYDEYAQYYAVEHFKNRIAQ
jgi:hypothetical protein